MVCGREWGEEAGFELIGEDCGGFRFLPWEIRYRFDFGGQCEAAHKNQMLVFRQHADMEFHAKGHGKCGEGVDGEVGGIFLIENFTDVLAGFAEFGRESVAVESGVFHGAEDVLNDEPLGDVREEFRICTKRFRRFLQSGEILRRGLTGVFEKRCDVVRQRRFGGVYFRGVAHIAVSECGRFRTLDPALSCCSWFSSRCWCR